MSGDIRELEAAAAAGHADARMALAVYAYRIAGAVSAMAASLGGLDAVAFYESASAAGVRRAVCARLGFLGVELDDDLNQGDPVDADVSTATSAVRVLVVAAREAHRRPRGARGSCVHSSSSSGRQFTMLDVVTPPLRAVATASFEMGEPGDGCASEFNTTCTPAAILADVCRRQIEAIGKSLTSIATSVSIATAYTSSRSRAFSGR